MLEPLAEMIPSRKRRADLDDTADAVQGGSGLRAALDGIEPSDDRFTEELNAALSLLTSEETDPWEDA